MSSTVREIRKTGLLQAFAPKALATSGLGFATADFIDSVIQGLNATAAGGALPSPINYTDVVLEVTLNTPKHLPGQMRVRITASRSASTAIRSFLGRQHEDLVFDIDI